MRKKRTLKVAEKLEQSRNKIVGDGAALSGADHFRSGRKERLASRAVEERREVRDDALGEQSALLADAFTSEKFLEGQRAFLSSKGKTVPAMVFTLAKLTRPLWGMLLPPAHDKNIKE